MSEHHRISAEVDARGTRCPIPLLRAKQALKSLNVGERIKVLATDPSAKGDFDAMLSHLPHWLVDYQVENDDVSVHVFVIEKGL